MLLKLKELATRFRRPLRWLMWIAVGLLLLIAILAGLTRALGSTADRYQPQLTTYLSQQLNMPVRIGQLTLDWYGLNPELVLNDVVVSDKQVPTKQLLTIRHLSLQLSLLDTLLNRRLMLKALVLDNTVVATGFYDQLQALNTHTSSTALPWDKLQINMTDLNTPIEGKLPGLENANLAFQLHQRKGTFAIEDNSWVVHVPWLFREPLQLADTNLTGNINFGKNGFSVSIDDGKLRVPEGVMNINLNLSIPKTGSADIQLDAKGQFKTLTRASVYNYMPIAVLSPSLLSWLDKSILHVDSAQSHFVLRGQLKNFPFVNNQQGEFLVDTQLQGASLDFEPGWPIVANANAHMVFKGQSMSIIANKGEFAGLPIQLASAKIPVMAPGQPVVLHIGAKVQTDVSQLLPALDQLPLTSITHLSKQLQGKGPINAGIHVTLPLENTSEAPVLKGYAALQQVQLNAVAAPRLPLTQLAGALTFTLQGLNAKGLTAQWLGMPLKVSLRQGGTSGETQVLASLQVNTPQLKAWVPENILRFFKGQTTIQLQMLASLTDVPSIQLSSSMQGMAVSLPPPLQKTASAKMPAQIEVTEIQGKGWQMKAGYGSNVNVQAMLARIKQQWSLTALALGWGSQPTLTPQQITIALRQPSIDLDAWMKTWTGIQAKMPSDAKRGRAQVSAKGKSNATKAPSVAASSASPSAHALSLPIQAQINTQQLSLSGYRLNGVSLQAGYDGKQANATVTSEEVTGKINYQLPQNNSGGQLQINLKQLNLPGSSLSSSQTMKWQRFPATQFTCQTMQVGKLSLGQVAVSLTPMNGGLSINQFKLTTQSVTVNASGSWLWQSGQTQLGGSLNTANLSQALRDLGLSGNIQANQASAQFKFNWSGAPWQMSLSALQGTASINIGRGKITGLSQSADASVGLGKLISLLSLEGLMRIGDLSTEGFAFDKVTGQFKFNQGVVQVDQSEIKGVIADLFFQGQIGLPQKNYNLRMQVVGQLTSSLPVIATVAGGPIAGAVTWVVNKAVGPAIDKAGSSTYKITGTWQKPVIAKAP